MEGAPPLRKLRSARRPPFQTPTRCLRASRFLVGTSRRGFEPLTCESEAHRTIQTVLPAPRTSVDTDAASLRSAA